ncbi:MAG: hypothetical protein LBL96_06590 [Clostridiales bacterium]|jgi:vacuolar-type H+-ATPase subunit H|nr:hypothetical protein [Clostridiales bacterium]
MPDAFEQIRYAENEADAIISEARRKAADITESANREAERVSDEIITRAKEDSAQQQAKANSIESALMEQTRSSLEAEKTDILARAKKNQARAIKIIVDAIASSESISMAN